MHLRTKDKGFFAGPHNLGFFAVPSAKRLLFCAPLPVFWNEINCLRPLLVLYLSCLAYYSGTRLGDNDCNTRRVQQMVALDDVILTLGEFL